MIDHRFEAHACVEPGECEVLLDGRRLQLVRVVLTDCGPITRDDGSSYRRPDVLCPLRPSEARELALRLLELASHRTGTTR
jgi:hypothetical protein